MNSDNDKVTMIKCDKCGYFNLSNSKICTNCGNKFNAKEDAPQVLKNTKEKKIIKVILTLICIIFVLYIAKIVLSSLITLFSPQESGEINAKKYIRKKYNFDVEIISSDVHSVSNMFGIYEGNFGTVYMKKGNEEFEVVVGREISDNYQFDKICSDFISKINSDLNLNLDSYYITPNEKKYGTVNKKYDGTNLGYFLNRFKITSFKFYYSIDEFKKIDILQLKKTLNQLDIKLNDVYSWVDFYFVFGKYSKISIDYKMNYNTKDEYTIYLDEYYYDEIGITNANELFNYIVKDDSVYHTELNKLDNGKIELKAY